MSWQERAEALADKLSSAGELRDPAWRRAFLEVPRHVFVPGFDLEEAYADEALVTQHRWAEVEGGSGLDLPTSSASAPGVVAVMLDRLAVAEGMRVLEIGTGTGYNAALLCHRLGADSVYSVDLDPALVAQAGEQLAGAGWRPYLRAADGYSGWPEPEPVVFDRIVATCGIGHIPPEWIRQLAPRGRIVAPLLGDGGALMVLDRTPDEDVCEVVGRFEPYPVSFMPLRDDVDSPLAPGRELHGAPASIGQYGRTLVSPDFLTGQPDRDLLLFLQLHLPGVSSGVGDGPQGANLTIHTRDGYAEVMLKSQDGRWPTVQYGRRLWDTVEHVWQLWQALGMPSRDRFGISALDDPAKQYVWLDDPDGAYAWPMPL